MNLKPLRVIFLTISVIFHLLLILQLGYFLSPEFSVYPYLYSHGFLPYQNIIDQHLPVFLFGPLSIPSWLSTNTQPLLAFFLAVTGLIDIIFYSSLIRNKVRWPLFWLVVWIISSSYFSGNILWLETLTNLCLITFYFLYQSNKSLSKIVAGSMLGLVVLCRPTIIIGLTLFLICIEFKPRREYIAGFMLPFLVCILFLAKFNLFGNFYQMWKFNSDIYPIQAFKAPNLRQLLITSFWLSPVFITAILTRKWQYIFTVISLCLLVFPRFEYEHLQPLLLISLILLSRHKLFAPIIVFPISFVFSIFVIIKLFSPSYGNFYLNDDTKKAAQIISQLSGSYVYLLGANDLIYPLSRKLPPGNYYLPSLPWYLSQENFVEYQKLALSANPQVPILVNKNSKVDGKLIIPENHALWLYIQKYYKLVQQIGPYELYENSH